MGLVVTTESISNLSAAWRNEREKWELDRRKKEVKSWEPLCRHELSGVHEEGEFLPGCLQSWTEQPEEQPEEQLEEQLEGQLEEQLEEQLEAG